MSKYRIGDTVIPVTNRKTKPACGWNSYMTKSIDKTQKITKVLVQSSYVCYRLEDGYNWHEDDLTLATKEAIAAREAELAEQKRKEEEESRKQELKLGALEIIGYAKT